MTTRGRPLKRQDVVREDCPISTIELAERRTAPLLRSFHLMDYDIRELARNSYLQGIRDTVEMAIDCGLFVEDAVPNKLYLGEVT